MKFERLRVLNLGAKCKQDYRFRDSSVLKTGFGPQIGYLFAATSSTCRAISRSRRIEPGGENDDRIYF